ncbi:tetratricopeptide repeat protein [Telluribacter humicola]
MFWMRSLLMVFLAGILTTSIAAGSPLSINYRLETEKAGAEERPDSLLLQLRKNYARAVSDKKEVEAARYLHEMGRVMYQTGYYPQALDYYQQAEKRFREQQQDEHLARNLNDQGLLYYYSHQPDQARQYYDKALAIYQQRGDRAGRAETLGKIGHLYEKQQRYDRAFHLQRQALADYQRVDHQAGTAKIYENLGSIYEDLEQYDSAYVNYSKALLINKKNGNEIAQIEILNNLGDVLRKTGRYRQGMAYSWQALALAQQKGVRYQLTSAYNDLAKGYNLLNRNDSAYYYLSLSRRYQTDIYSEEANKQMALLQTLYDLEKKDNEIESLTHEQERARLITGSVVLIVLLVVVVGGLVISRQRLKLKNEQVLRSQNEARNQLMLMELKNKKLEEESLRQQLEVNAKGLTSHTLHLIEKNQFLDGLRSTMESMVKEEKRDQKKQLKQLIEQIQQNITHDDHWNEFRTVFEQVHQSFLTRLQQQCDNLTTNDIRLVALIRMNLDSRDVATLLGVSTDSLRVIRYRLRKKLNLPQGDSLSAYIQSI